MGSLLVWIARGLMVGGGALVGLLFEKLSSWVSGLLPDSFNTTGKDGKPAIWYVASIVIAAGAAIYFLAKAIAGKKKLLSLALLALLADYAVYGSIGIEGVIGASLIASFPANATNTRNITYLPEFIIFTIDTIATQFSITIAGDGVVFSLDGTGLTNMNGINVIGELPANTYRYRVADGYIGKAGSITIANASVGTALDVYGWSRSRGSNYIVHETIKAFANQALQLPPFLYAAFPSAAAAAEFTITRGNRVSDTMLRNELEGELAEYQEVIATRYNINNYKPMNDPERIASVIFRGAADQSVYIQRAQAAR